MPEMIITIDTGSERFTEKYLMTDKEVERLIYSYRAIHGEHSVEQPPKIDANKRMLPQPPIIKDRTNAELITHLCDNLHGELLKMIDHQERQELLKTHKPLEKRKS